MSTTNFSALGFVSLGSVLCVGLLACATDVRQQPSHSPASADQSPWDDDAETDESNATSTELSAVDEARTHNDDDDDDGHGYGTVRGSSGAAKTRIDEHGQRYDASGRIVGRMTDDGQFYGADGAVAGRVDANGTVYGASGGVEGRIEANGTVYGDTGAQAGRVDASGTVYGPSGAVVGTIDASCTGDCRTQALRACLLE